MSSDNLNLWESVRTPDPKYTKKFTGKGGFKGTAITAMYLVRQATELWGPIGDKWGIKVINQQIVDGADGEKLHIVLAELHHPGGSFHCFGQTMLVAKRGGSDGYLFTDEDAPKKSLTDALTKGLSWLGFAADVHIGLFDDNKYVAQANAEFRQEEQSEQDRDAGLKLLDIAVKKGSVELEKTWSQVLSIDMRRACKDDLEGYKAKAKEYDAKRGQVAHA